MIGRFMDGLKSPITGARMLWTTDGLWKYAVVPFFLTALSFIVGFYYGFSPFNDWLMGWLPNPSDGFFWKTLFFLGKILGYILFFLGLLFFVVVIANLVAMPFHSLLAEKTLMALGRINEEPFKVRKWIKKSLFLFRVSLVKSVLFLFIGSFFFLMSFIPVVQAVVGFLGLVIIAFDCIDYSLEGVGLGLGQRLEYFRSHAPELCGMALAMGATLLIPGLNFLIYPICVVGGAKIVARR